MPNPNQNPYFSTVLNPTGAASPSSPTTTTTNPSGAATAPPHSRVAAPPSAQQPAQAFTATQRSLQARNKPFNLSPSSYSAEPFEQRQRRDQAAMVLESLEMLIWYSNARNESISQTRQYFQNVVLGIENGEGIVWKEEWEVPVEKRNTSQGDERGRRPIASPKSVKDREKKRRGSGV